MLVKVCGCGQRYDRKRWGRLKLVGVLIMLDDKTAIESRACLCESTISIKRRAHKGEKDKRP